jgi:TatD DNase family protein
VIRRASDAGVGIIINPATSLDDSRRAVELADRHPGLYACVGIHPHEAGRADETALRGVEELSSHPRVVAIGEIGLDFHYDGAPRAVQEAVLRDQLAIARRRNLPVVIHTRESLPETAALVRESIASFPSWRSHRAYPESRYPAPKGVFHCYAGDVPTAWDLIQMGFLVSFPGILTFKNSGNMADVAARISIEHILLETDSPYMSPAPHRGTRNEPSRIGAVAGRLAALQKLSVEDVARATAYGAYRLFGVGRPGEPRNTYQLRDSLYINLTIRCNADCVFCDRKAEAVIKGHNLRIEREAGAAEIIREIGDPRRYREVVFCGYGEPTIRLDTMKKVAAWVKGHDGATRLDTNGHGNLIHGRDIIPELVGLLDAVSISLNTADPVQYGALMRLDPAKFFSGMVEFARSCVRVFPRVTMTIVDMDGIDTERARRLIEQDIGAVFVSRPYF